MTSKKPPLVFLLAIWGEDYIEKFFDFGLRSLLASGNIPALSQEYACTFLFLTQNKDIPYFKAQSKFSMLLRYCEVEFIEISDLIFSGSYSATLTLAFERGMRSRGKEMCATYFFFLVADYIMANGALGNLRRYLQAGYSGITTGNFLVVEEYVSQKLKEIIEANSKGLIELNAHEMLSLGMPYLHPVSTAQTVTQFHTHATHANRLFWRVNDKVIVGRFYLRHMLCIKPEIDNYVIGSSCDYSFIHEMCPSGNVAHIQDSDDYCVIELSPFDYEMNWLKSGPFDRQTLANHLSQWTTQAHRSNAHIPIIFHSEPLEEYPKTMILESALYIRDLESRLCPTPQPFRGHFYWKACIESILYWVLQQKEQTRYHHEGIFAGIVGSKTFFPILNKHTDDRYILKVCNPAPSLPLTKKMLRKSSIQKILQGISPKTSFWHLQWLDDYYLRKNITKSLSKHLSCLVIAFEPIGDLIHWLETNYNGRCHYQYYHFFKERSAAELRTLLQHQKQVIIWLSEGSFYELGNAMRLCANHLPADHQISVYIKHKKAIDSKPFKKMLDICLADLLNSSIYCKSTEKHFSLSRGCLEKVYMQCAHKLFAPRKPLWQRTIGFIGLGVLNSACTFLNVLNLMGTQSTRKNTSAILQFECQK